VTRCQQGTTSDVSTASSADLQTLHTHNACPYSTGFSQRFQGNVWTLPACQLIAWLPLLTQEHTQAPGDASWHPIMALYLETGPLPPQDHKSGTVCRPITDYVDCHRASSGGYSRHFYSDGEATAQCDLFLTVPNRNILTYLLTYLQICTNINNIYDIHI